MRAWLTRSKAIWSYISAAAMCLGIWADRDSLPAADVVAMIGTVLPPVALGVGIFCIGMLLTAGFWWAADLCREGPSIRQLQSLAPRMERCMESMVEYCNYPPIGARYPARFNAINVEASFLLSDLRELGLTTPWFDHADNLPNVWYVISYFGTFIPLAYSGDLRRARIQSERVPSEWVYKEPQDG